MLCRFTMMQIPKEHVVRAYINPLPGASEAVQLSAAKTLGKRVVVYRPDQRDAWLKALGPSCTGWTWRLAWIAKTRREVGRPIVDYSAAVALIGAAIGQGCTMIEGESGATSESPKAWAEAVERGGRQVVSRRLTRPEASMMGATGGAKARDRSLKAQLKRKPLSAHAAVLRAMWKSTEYGNRDAAADAINAYLAEHELTGPWSPATLYRAFQGRGTR